jgi:hypothetical protein
MHPNSRKLFLLATACAEAATGACLIVAPAVLLSLLLGVENVASVAILLARLAGAALLAIGIASWMAKADTPNPAQFGLLAGILFYNAAAALLLAFAGAVSKMQGILLWPVVAFHVLMAIWTLTCMHSDDAAGNLRGEAVDRRTSKN